MRDTLIRRNVPGLSTSPLSFGVRAVARPLAAGLVLSLSLLGACVEQDEDKPSEDDMKIAKQNILTTAPTPRFPVNADLDGKIVYLGMDADPAVVEPGRDVKLTHYWKVVAAPGEGWRIFTHLDGPNNQPFINVDHAAVKGKYPVTQWKVGEIIRDEHNIRLPPNWPHAQLLIYTGLWKPAVGRMAIKSGAHDADGRVLAATLVVQGAVAKAVAAPRKRYVARMISKPIKVDGKLDDPAWGAAPSTGPFVNTMTGAPVDQKTEAKFLWDNKFLYVAFDNADSDVWASLTKRDDKLWTQEADELMIDADGNGKTYVELQVAPNGTLFDTYLPEYRKYEDTIDPKKKPYSWNSKMNVKVHVDGTLNKRDDQDKGWTVEMAIPLEDVRGMDKAAAKLPPSPGDVWRINMFRMDMPTGKPQQASGWSAPLVGDFHALDKFGELVFADDKGNLPPHPPLPVAGAPAPMRGKPVSDDKKGGAGVKAAPEKEPHAKK
jgi:Carbohydrate family 9 binding domain-like